MLHELLDELPDTTRAALWMRAVEDRPHREIAALLQMSESAVKMRIAGGWTSLRRSYEERAQATPRPTQAGASQHTAPPSL